MMRAAAFCAVLAVASADIEFSRTVTKVLDGASGTVTLDHGCSKTDQYGSNDCTLHWGQNYTAKVDATLPRPIGEGATLEVDLKLDGLIPFKFTCAACGAKCEFEVPIVKKQVSFNLPPCPLVGAGHVVNATTLPLPSKSPSPVSANAKGTATVKDKDGSVMVAVDIDAKISK